MESRPKILCVDDEPAVLEGISRNLRRSFEVLSATSGPLALEVLEREPNVAVIVSDMRMPVMNGAAFLAKARALRPTAVRMLLTGHAEVDAALAAVNEGRIFRFLTKPCDPKVLQTALTEAAEQYRLLESERVLLEQTLHGSIKTLVDVLAITNPLAFGRAGRIKTLVTELAGRLGHEERWQVEVASLMSPLGWITLPPAVVELICTGQQLTAEQEDMVARLPIVTDQLLANIPRLEQVRAILREQDRPHRPWTDGADPDPRREIVRRGVALLRVATDFDLLEASGNTGDGAIGLMSRREGRYDPAVVRELGALRGSGVTVAAREVRLAELHPGMRFAKDVLHAKGMLLVARGHDVTIGLIERFRNYPPGSVKEPMLVTILSQ